MLRTEKWVFIAVMTGCLFGGGACHQRRHEPAPSQEPAAASAQMSSQARAASKHAAMGDEYYQRGRVAEAQTEWRLALDLDPTRQDLARKLDQTGEAGTEGEKGNPPVAEGKDGDMNQRISATLAQAQRHYQASRIKEAELAYKQILLLEPSNSEARSGLARLQEETYQPDAQRAFDKMTENLYLEALQGYRKKDWDRAEAKLSEAAKLNPDQPQVKKFLERTLAEKAKLKDAVRARELADAAAAAEKSGDWVSACQLWEEAARMRPPAPGAEEGVRRARREAGKTALKILSRAQQDAQAGLWPAALAGYEKVLVILPDHADALSGARKARSALDAQKKSQGSKAEAQKLYNRGVEAYRKGDLPGAVAAWEGAAAADPTDAGIREQLLRAKKEASAALEKNRRLAQARYEDGLAAYQRGELDEALSAWKETLELDPEHPKARANIKRVEQEMK